MNTEPCTHCSEPKTELRFTETDPLLTKSEAAKMLNVSLRTIERMVATRTVATVRVGRHVRIRTSAIETYLSARTTNAIGGAR